MNAQEWFKQLNEFLKGISSPEYDATFSPLWESIDRLISNVNSPFMGEHVLAFYAAANGNLFSGSIRFLCSADDYRKVYQSFSDFLKKKDSNAILINPYRLSISDQLIHVVEEGLRGAKKQADENPFTASDIERRLKYFATELVKYRTTLLSMVSDPWSELLAPDWKKPTGFLFLRDSKQHQVGMLEFEASEFAVEFRHEPLLDNSPPLQHFDLSRYESVSKLFRRILRARNFWSFNNIARNFSDPFRFAFEDFKRTVQAVNSKLEAPNAFMLAELSPQNIETLARQEAATMKLVKERLGIGPDFLARGFTVHIAVDKTKSNDDLGMLRDAFVEVVFEPNETMMIECKVYDSGDEVRAFERGVRAKRDGLIHSTLLSVWLGDKSLESIIDPLEVPERITDRATDGSALKARELQIVERQLILFLSDHRDGISESDVERELLKTTDIDKFKQVLASSLRRGLLYIDKDMIGLTEHGRSTADYLIMERGPVSQKLSG